jgi:hypothetical protein
MLRNNTETTPLKALANAVLERNNQRNKVETTVKTTDSVDRLLNAPNSADYFPSYSMQQCNEVMLRHMSYYRSSLGVDKKSAYEMAAEIYKQVNHLYIGQSEPQIMR